MGNLYNNTPLLQEVLDAVNALPEAIAIPNQGIFDSDDIFLDTWENFVEVTRANLAVDYTITNRMIDESDNVHLSNALASYFNYPIECNLKIGPGITRIGNYALQMS